MEWTRKKSTKPSEEINVQFDYAGLRFESDMKKALANYKKHGIRFEQACQVFVDPFVRIVDATEEDETREAAVGFTEDWTLLFVVHVIRQHGVIRIISARRATRAEWREYEDNG